MSDDQRDGEESLAEVLASIRARVGQHEREMRGQAKAPAPSPDPDDAPLILGGGDSTLDPAEDDAALLLTDPVAEAPTSAEPEPEEPLHLSDYMDAPEETEEEPLILTTPEEEEPLVLSDMVAEEDNDPLILSDEDSAEPMELVSAEEDSPLVLDDMVEDDPRILEEDDEPLVLSDEDADAPLTLTEDDAAPDEEPLILGDPVEEDAEPLILSDEDADAPLTMTEDDAAPDEEPLIPSDMAEEQPAPALRLVEDAAPASVIPAMAQQGLPPAPAPEPTRDAVPSPASPEPAAAEIDEETLRAMIRDVIREELQGDLGQTLSNNIGAMIREELANAFKRG
jgi:hypothetical protein